MKKTKELADAIVELISSYVDRGDYSIQLEKYEYESNGYCDGSVIIGGMSCRCSFNKDGYICWLGGLKLVLDDMKSLERKLCREAKEMIEGNCEEIRKQRIKELEYKLKELKGE